MNYLASVKVGALSSTMLFAYLSIGLHSPEKTIKATYTCRDVVNKKEKNMSVQQPRQLTECRKQAEKQTWNTHGCKCNKELSKAETNTHDTRKKNTPNQRMRKQHRKTHVKLLQTCTIMQIQKNMRRQAKKRN